jgi:hypothetical protein
MARPRIKTVREVSIEEPIGEEVDTVGGILLYDHFYLLHEESVFCWCQPYIVDYDEELDIPIYAHRGKLDS